MPGLNEQEYELLTFIEMEFSVNGFLPSKDLCCSTLVLKPAKYDSMYNKSAFTNALLARGISKQAVAGLAHNGVVTVQQMNVINTLLDKMDTRSDRKKLSDMGVASQTYQGWCRDPAFNLYVTRRVEALFPNMVNEATRALGDNVTRGDMSAIKLVYEMTGRWSSKTVGELNVDFLLMKVIETISKHVTDPIALEAIASDLSSLAQMPQPSSVGVAQPLALLPGVPGRPNAEIEL